MSCTAQFRQRRREAGFTLVEVLIAGVVLVTGILGILGLFALAIGNNSRSRLDSTSTMLAQSVVEQISGSLAQGGPDQLTDCASSPNTWTITKAPGGASLKSDGTIDFNGQSQSSLMDAGCAGGGGTSCYAMSYVVCNNGGASGTPLTYDVRWNIQAVGSTRVYLVTVGARPLNTGLARFSFGLPITLRSYVGEMQHDLGL